MSSGSATGCCWSSPPLRQYACGAEILPLQRPLRFRPPWRLSDRSGWRCWSPGGEDFLLARHWIESSIAEGLRAADGLHLALAQRRNLCLISADQLLVSAAHRLGIDAQLVA
jgi:hypothetical protein